MTELQVNRDAIEIYKKLHTGSHDKPHLGGGCNYIKEVLENSPLIKELQAQLSAKDAIIAELQKESLRGDRQILLEIVECMEMNGHGFVDAMTAFENVRKVIKKYNIKTHYTQPPKGI